MVDLEKRQKGNKKKEKEKRCRKQEGGERTGRKETEMTYL